MINLDNCMDPQISAAVLEIVLVALLTVLGNLQIHLDR